MNNQKCARCGFTEYEHIFINPILLHQAYTKTQIEKLQICEATGGFTLSIEPAVKLPVKAVVFVTEEPVVVKKEQREIDVDALVKISRSKPYKRPKTPVLELTNYRTKNFLEGNMVLIKAMLSDETVFDCNIKMIARRYRNTFTHLVNYEDNAVWQLILKRYNHYTEEQKLSTLLHGDDVVYSFV